MPIGEVPPPSSHPDDTPTVCIEINVEWIPILLGAIQPLKYPEYWSGTLDENRGARKDFGILLDQIMRAEDCGMTRCCEDTIYITRIDPDTGRLQRSSDDGVTWTTDPNDLLNHTIKMTPIVRPTTGGTKCDAATNFLEHFNDIITGQSENIGTAITVFDLAAAVAGIIIDVIVAIGTGGAGLPWVVALETALFAAASAAFAEGKTAFDDYWTNENKDLVLCAAFCTIGDNGQFSQTQWEDFKHKVRLTLPAGAALDFTMTAVNAGGYVGGSNMASYGAAADADCSACDCGTCVVDNWHLGTWQSGSFVPLGTEVSRDSTSITAASVDRGDGSQWIYVSSTGSSVCCDLSWDILTGSVSANAGIPCGTDHDISNAIPYGLTPSNNVNTFGQGSSTPFTAKITFSHV